MTNSIEIQKMGEVGKSDNNWGKCNIHKQLNLVMECAILGGSDKFDKHTKNGGSGKIGQ